MSVSPLDNTSSSSEYLPPLLVTPAILHVLCFPDEQVPRFRSLLGGTQAHQAFYPDPQGGRSAQHGSADFRGSRCRLRPYWPHALCYCSVPSVHMSAASSVWALQGGLGALQHWGPPLGRSTGVKGQEQHRLNLPHCARALKA